MKTSKVNTEPYAIHDHIHVDYELQFKKDLIKPGVIIKFKNHRSQFKFRCLVHNSKTQTSWIDAYEIGTYQFHSFSVERLLKVVKPKRSRRHKAIV